METPERKLLILDLDETLIYATEKKPEREADFIVGQYFVYKRPFLEPFLEFCFERFEVAIWTTATKLYAEEILRKIVKNHQKLKFLWTRERCTYFFDAEARDHYFVKRMSKLRRLKYKLESIIVIDDSPNVWQSSYGNLVRINRFEGDLADNELQLLPIYLERLSAVRNVRKIEKRNWRNNL